MIEPVLLAVGLVAGCATVAARLRRAQSFTAVLGWSARGLMLLLLVAVLIRPGVPNEGQPVQATQADVFLVVDTTASVAAEDWSGATPRLSGIKADLRAIVDEFAGARFALITFDRTAVLRVPLTSDAAAILTATEILEPEVTAHAKGSSIGIAADLLEDQLRVAARAEPDRARAAFYFGDGEQTAATTPESFHSSARYLGGGTVFGYGTETGGPMLANHGPKQKEQEYIIDPATAAAAVSKMDPRNLRTIADDLGVPLDVRHPGSTVTAGEVQRSSVTSDGTFSRSGFTELYWVPALGLVGLLSIETGVLLAALTATRRGGTRS